MDAQHLLFGNRKKSGFLFGLIATFCMTLVMLTGMLSGLSPIPEPIPAAIMKWLFGPLPQPALMISGMIAHFLYGGIAGLLLFVIAKEQKPILQGLAWGILLWLIMHLVVLPLIGWGFFGGAMNPKIVPATLILHLIYGGVIGYGLMKYFSKAEIVA